MSRRARNGLFVDYCAKDFLDGTQTLDPWEELAYRRIVDMIYATNDGLEDNDRKLAWQTKVGNRWLRVKQSLIAQGKIFIEDGRVRNRRCIETLEKTSKKIAQKSGAGTASKIARETAQKNPQNVAGKPLNNKETGGTGVDAPLADPLPKNGALGPENGNGKSNGEGNVPKNPYTQEDNTILDAVPQPAGAGELAQVRAVVKSFHEKRGVYWPHECTPAAPDTTLETQAKDFIRAGATPELCAEIIDRVMAQQAKDERPAPWSLKFCHKTLLNAAISHRKATQPSADAPGTPPGGLASDQSTQWRARCRGFVQRGLWPPLAGPKPGMPGCQVPPAILAEFGLLPPPSEAAE